MSNKIKTLEKAIEHICKNRKFVVLGDTDFSGQGGKLICPVHNKVHKYNFGTFRGIDVDVDSPLRVGLDTEQEVIDYANTLK